VKVLNGGAVAGGGTVSGTLVELDAATRSGGRTEGGAAVTPLLAQEAARRDVVTQSATRRAAVVFSRDTLIPLHFGLTRAP
jgi:hypothetical protein